MSWRIDNEGFLFEDDDCDDCTKDKLCDKHRK